MTLKSLLKNNTCLPLKKLEVNGKDFIAAVKFLRLKTTHRV